MADVDRIVPVGQPPGRPVERQPPRKRRRGEPPAQQKVSAAEPAAEKSSEADRDQSGQKHLDICV